MQILKSIIGRNGHNYTFCRDKHVFCHDKNMLVATKRLSWQTYICRDKYVQTQNLCRDKYLLRQKKKKKNVTNVLWRQAYICRDKSFVAIKMILVAAPVNDRNQATSRCQSEVGPMHSCLIRTSLFAWQSRFRTVENSRYRLQAVVYDIMIITRIRHLKA